LGRTGAGSKNLPWGSTALLLLSAVHRLRFVYSHHSFVPPSFVLNVDTLTK
jgi:hypothetical protein